MSSPTMVSLFGTFSLPAAATTQDLLFAGGAGVGGLAATRLTSPPMAGIIRRVTLRTVSVVGTPGGTDYHVRLFGTRIAAVAAANASFAASFIGRTLSPLVPVAADIANAARVDPDLNQVVEWPYNLSPLVAGPADTGVPPGVPGLLARIDLTAVPGGDAIVIGIGIMIESRVPNFPSGPQFQRGGTEAAAAWPLNTTS